MLFGVRPKYIDSEGNQKNILIEGDVVETDPTVPAWAKAETKPTYTAEEVGAATAEQGIKADNAVPNTRKINGKALSGDITLSPSDIGAATAEQGAKADTALQSYTETDPTVPSWAKASTKPTYTKSEVGLGSVQNYGIATQEQAEAGTSNTVYMTPLRTKQAIQAQGGGGGAGKFYGYQLNGGYTGAGFVISTSGNMTVSEQRAGGLIQVWDIQGGGEVEFLQYDGQRIIEAQAKNGAVLFLNRPPQSTQSINNGYIKIIQSTGVSGMMYGSIQVFNEELPYD